MLKSNYNISERINEDYHNGYYIYTVGSFNTYDQANAKKKSLKRDGIIDAFVVVFKNQKRLNKLSDL
ncbi:MAG: hypothetical protein U9R32_08685 [Bacteroidota bacterium]|nr:hypothetical protein [Bacteroidota bacterium]